MISHNKELEIDYLKKIFRCNSEIGELRWHINTGRVSAGMIAGCVTDEGYRAVGHKGFTYMAHRIIWAMHYGSWPDHQIDHINCIKDDNRICNLRPCNDSQNQMNRAKCRGTSRYKGVDLHQGRWRARIRPGDGTRLNLGYFTTEDAAGAAYAEAAAKFHGEFARV
jgi:hypothetical protein